MLASLLQWFKKHISETLAIIAGVAVLIFTVTNPGWWGDRAFGVLIGVAVLAAVFPLVILVLERILPDTDWIIAWVILIIPVATALVLRRFSNRQSQISIPALPSTRTVLLVAFVISILVLVDALARAFARGESVSVESHWGGLGGGVGGWRLSTPLIYLSALILLITASIVIAWRVFIPPEAALGGPKVPDQAAATSTPAGKESPSTNAPANSSTPPPVP
ncbi:MAG TPA: hypothetical protein VE961_20535 [Pyrinomonadaceae bacterium]|nr:hypothetical protein [Pyrinomonadaceae bacterium]